MLLGKLPCVWCVYGGLCSPFFPAKPGVSNLSLLFSPLRGAFPLLSSISAGLVVGGNVKSQVMVAVDSDVKGGWFRRKASQLTS